MVSTAWSMDASLRLWKAEGALTYLLELGEADLESLEQAIL
jgi:hypothetical protein